MVLLPENRLKMTSEFETKLLVLLERFVLSHERTTQAQEKTALCQEKLVKLSETNLKQVEKSTKIMTGMAKEVQKQIEGQCPVCYGAGKCEGWCHRKTYP